MFENTPDDLQAITACPLCGAGPEARRVLTDRGARFDGERAVICMDCGLVFLDPRLTLDAIERYYESDAFSREVRGDARPDEAALRYRDMRATRRWALIRRHVPAQGRVLEIGCGAGNFLRLLGKNGYSAVGIDPSTGYVEHAVGSGLAAVAGLFPDDLPEMPKFDLVFTFHVLEHVPDPHEILVAVRRRIREGGIFVIEYPDVELASRRRFLPHTYFERAHLFDFSRRTLESFLLRAGFRVREVAYETSERPYDRNVLLFCEATDPERVAPARDDAARDLADRLRKRLAFSRLLMPLRPLWRRLRGLDG